MRAPGTLRSLRFIPLVLAASTVAGLHALSTARRYPSVSTTPHQILPDAELTPHSAGGGPEGGEVFSLAIVSTQPATVFAAFEHGGVFKSADGGANWAPADRGLPSNWACGLVADPRDRSVLYAECNLELFKTTDRGATWQQLDVDDARLPAIAPSDSRIVYQEPNPYSIVRSADGGGHWEEVPTSGLLYGAESYVVDSRNRLVLYAGTYDNVFKSRDGGATWAPLGPGLPSNEAIETLALDPLNENTVFAGTTVGLYKTITSGKTWARVGDGLPDGRVGGLIVAGTVSQLLYAEVDGRLFRSADGAGHWRPIDESLQQAVHRTFVVDPWSPSTLYAGTSAGVSVTTDGGATWRRVNRGIARMSVTDLVLQGGNVPTLFVRGDAGSFSTSSNGATWRSVSGTEPFDTSRAAAEPGPRWREVELPGGRRPYALTVSARNADVAYATSMWSASALYAGVWRTLNGGVAWEQVDSCSKTPLSRCHPVTDPNDVNTAFVVIEGVGIGGGGDLIRKTVDGGRTWNDVDFPGLSEAFVVLPTSPTTLFAQVYGRTGGFDLLKSTDSGAHWMESSEGLPWEPEIAAIVMDTANPKHLFAGTKGRGVFQSLDGGATWRPTSGH